MKFRAPANVLLRRAQLTLILAALLPTILTTPVGIVLLSMDASRAVTIVGGVLVLAFCTSSLVGFVLGAIFLSRGASLAKVQNDFLSSVSHELTTPITSVRMFIETLRDERVTDPAERRKCLAIIDREMGRLDGLVSKLVALSKLESGRQPFEFKEVGVTEIVNDALAAFDVLRIGSQVALEVELEPGLHVLGDRASLAQAIVNLLTNAWKYTPADGRRIRLAARSFERRAVAIEVSDNGPGILEHEQRRIFEDFERGTAGRHVTGSGLGLAIVRRIVKYHRGRVALVSRPGEGALFRITLPRASS